MKVTKLRTDGTFHNRKSEKGKTVFLALTQAFSSALSHPYSRPIQVANVQEFFSLSRCFMMSCGVSHRCLTIVMQRMCCQRSTLRVGNSCYISAVMGHPKDMPVDATVLYSQHPNPTYSKYHLLVSSYHSSVHMTHSKVIKLQSVEWSLSKLYSELAQWQPLLFLVFVKITKTTTTT